MTFRFRAILYSSMPLCNPLICSLMFNLSNITKTCPVQVFTEIFSEEKIEKFISKCSTFFYIFAQNIHCGFGEVVLTSTHNVSFGSKLRKLGIPLYTPILLYLSVIMQTCPCNVYPLEPHFYIGKLGYAGVYLFFLFLLQNIDCGYSVEPPRRGGSNEYPQSMFWSKNKKNRYTPANPSFTI